MTVDLEDASGATVTGALSPHTLRYQTLITIPGPTATPAVPDYLHQQVSVSGTVLATDPRHPDTPTAADGRFTAAFVPTRTSVDLTAAPGAYVNYPGAIDLLSPQQHLRTTQAPVRFAASTHALNLKQGATGTVTGRAEIQTASGRQPLPHTGVGLFGTTPAGSDVVAGRTTTDSQGSYALRVSSDNAAPTAQLALGTTDLPFQQFATQPFSLHVAHITHIEASAELADASSLKVSGYVSYEDAHAHWPTKPTVTLQYSRDGRSGWKNATAIPIELRCNKPLFEEDFARTLPTTTTDAYWRARFHATPDPVRKRSPISFTGTQRHRDRHAGRHLGRRLRPRDRNPVPEERQGHRLRRRPANSRRCVGRSAQACNGE